MSTLRILVIDDHEDAAVGLRQILELDGHRVVVALDGPSALARLDELDDGERFDLILCDLGLPGMDGFEVAEAIRKRAGGDEIPLFALTGYGDRATAARTVEAGFDGHLVKPLDVKGLQALVGKLA